MEGLNPCPWCKGGQTRLDEHNYWTGRGNRLINVTLRHWCEGADDRIEIKRPTRQEAIDAWNQKT